MQTTEVEQAQSQTEHPSNVRRLARLFGSILRISSAREDDSAFSSNPTILADDPDIFGRETIANTNVDADHQIPMPGSFTQILPSLNLEEASPKAVTFEDACSCLDGCACDSDVANGDINFKHNILPASSVVEDSDEPVICLFEPGSCPICHCVDYGGKYEDDAEPLAEHLFLHERVMEDGSDEELEEECLEQDEGEASTHPDQALSSSYPKNASQLCLLDEDAPTPLASSCPPAIVRQSQYESYLTGMLGRLSPPTLVATIPSQAQMSDTRITQPENGIVCGTDQEPCPTMDSPKRFSTKPPRGLRAKEEDTYLGISESLIFNDHRSANEFRARFMQLSKEQRRETRYPTTVKGFGWRCQVPLCAVGAHKYYLHRHEMLSHYLLVHPGMPFREKLEYVENGEYNQPILPLCKYERNRIHSEEHLSLEPEIPTPAFSAPKGSDPFVPNSPVREDMRSFLMNGPDDDDDNSSTSFHLPPSMFDHHLTLMTLRLGYSEPEDSPDEEPSANNEQSLLHDSQPATGLQSPQSLPGPFNAFDFEFFKHMKTLRRQFDEYEHRMNDRHNPPTIFEGLSLKLSTDALILAGNLLLGHRT